MYIEATQDENGGFSVAISDSEGQDMVKTAKENEVDSVVITPKASADAQKVTVTMPTSTVSGIAKDTHAGVVISTPVVNVQLKNSTLGELAKQNQDISVSAEKNETGALRVTVSAGSKKLSAVPGGMTAVIPVDQTSGSGVVAVLVKADGTEEIIRYSARKKDGLAVRLDGSATVCLKDNSKAFADTEQHWAGDNISFITAREIFNGTGKDTFTPDAEMTRGMLVTVLYTLDGRTPVEKGSEFHDVAEDAWYADAVKWASGNQMISGVGNGGFGPNQSISREQLALILFGYAKQAGLVDGERGTVSQFVDGDQVSAWAKDAVEWAVGFGLMSGKDGGRIDPTGCATRAEVATMVRCFVEKRVE